MKFKRILAGFMACMTLMATVPGVTAYAASEEPVKQIETIESDKENVKAEAEDSSKDETESDMEVVLDENMKLSQEDLMALMGLFFGNIGSLSDNPVGTVDVDYSYLNMREGAGMDFAVIMHLLDGQKVEVTGEEGDWYQITVPEQVGYVYKDYLDVENKNPDGSFNITINEEAMDMLTSLAMGMFFKDNSTPALTPDGNLTLVDDVGSTTGAGKQFITLVTKAGNYFYLVIDRDDKGEENVHFLNMVDEADLFALLDEDQQAAYQKPTESVPVPDEQPSTDNEDAEKPDANEKDPDADEDEKSGSMMPLLGILLLMVGGAGAFFYLQTKKKKQAEINRPDPDADYMEDDEEDVYEFPADEDEADDFADESEYDSEDETDEDR